MASLMAVSSTSLVIPAALNFAYDNHNTEQSLSSILILSRGTAIILLILYVFYLYFQLKSHSQLFEESETCDSPKSTEKPKEGPEPKAGLEPKASPEPEEPAIRVLSPPEALATLFAITMTIALCAEYLVGTIDEVGEILNINRTFIGLVVLPLVGNAAEHISAIIAASKNKLDLAIGVALGSSLQIALFVTPTLVLVGWGIQQPMSLSFDPFGAIVFFLSVIVVTGLIQDGESNYLEGAMLVGTYGNASYIPPRTLLIRLLQIYHYFDSILRISR
jgi:Ca2+:H+ antiporter